MHKTVRYYITESEDRPVVRKAPVAIRPEPPVDQRSAGPSVVDSEQQLLDSKRSRLRDRLKAARLHRDNS